MTFRSKLELLAERFRLLLDSSGSLVHSNDLHEYSWSNWLWTSSRYRRAHLQIVDKFDDHKLYVLHCTIFPHFDNPAPIFGFDAICGPNKISGAFYDFSPAGKSNHHLIKWFANGPALLKWNKIRDLPEWATAIFSPHIIAVSNIQLEEEVDQLTQAAFDGMKMYLREISEMPENENNYSMMQNRYCYYQKKNPQVMRSMTKMGFSEEKINKFMDEILFPEVK